MVKEKVLTGKYKDSPLIYDHIKTADGQEIYFNSFSVMNFEPADKSRADYWADSSIRVDGTSSRDDDKDRRLISVQWRTGENSILQVNTKTYNRLMEAVLGKVPEDRSQTAAVPEQKSRSKLIPVILILIGIYIVLKFTILK